MKKLLLITAMIFALIIPAFAGGIHASAHTKVKTVEILRGKPGEAADVTRTINVSMRETDDGDMLFEPTSIKITKGETIRFNVTNKGELEHEFVIDTVEGNVKHKALMEKFDMEHDDPNSVRLDEGRSGEVIWTFSNAGTFEFACLIPGHYDSGMHGPIVVSEVTKNIFARIFDLLLSK
jgi:uncharacterized cupredoxin-like copper-binding protein